MNINAEICETAEKVINRLISTKKNDISNDHMVIENWEWPQGVAMYSLFKYYRNTGKKEYLDFILNWYEERIKEGLPARNVNTTAPMLTLAYLCESNPNEEYYKLCEEWATWIMEQMPRTEEGGLQHITTHDINPQQLWDDTLFMTVLFLAKFGKIAGRQNLIDEAVSQFLLHIKYLYHTKTGLWYHGWTFYGRHNFGEGLWARGNSWYTSAVVEFIEILDLKGPVKKYLVDTLEAQVSKLTELQSENGMWHTLLDEPDSYVETSATAAIAYGMLKAVRLNLIDSKYRQVAVKAVDAVLQRISEDGTVQQVSYGTAMGMNKEHYRDIAICPTAYGQGLTFLMLTECQRECV